MYYTATDNLGSINMIVDGSTGQIVDDLSYDACSVKLGFWKRSVTKPIVEPILDCEANREGRNRNPYDWTYSNITLSNITDRGYTGHEHMINFGLINMNGRVYDPYISQFLSPDPFVQDPTNTQNYNRFSYVLNNPLKYTDPSGYNYDAWGERNNWYSGMDKYKDSWFTIGGEILGIGNGSKENIFADNFYATKEGINWAKNNFGKNLINRFGQWGYLTRVQTNYKNVRFFADNEISASYTDVFNNVWGDPPIKRNDYYNYSLTIIGAALVELPNTANSIGSNYSTVLIAPNGVQISVGGRDIYDRLLKTGKYNLPLTKEISDVIVKNGRALGLVGKSVPLISSGFSIYSDYDKLSKGEIDEITFGVNVLCTSTGLLIGFSIGGVPGALIGVATEMSIKGAYKGSKWVHEGAYNWMNSFHPINWGRFYGF